MLSPRVNCIECIQLLLMYITMLARATCYASSSGPHIAVIRFTPSISHVPLSDDTSSVATRARASSRCGLSGNMDDRARPY
mmetsp:Transcript_5076/g.10313  ORF Transcript_5076/g.10313 Transcript_5076/m.10313 type:complete len:81 (-) Transcript_5076:2908-3150(-)